MQPLEIGNLRLFPFGAVLALALAAGVIWSMISAKDAQEQRTLEYFWLFAIPLGLVLSHVLYCLFVRDVLGDDIGEALVDLSWGYMLYGGLLGALIALALACRITGAGFGSAADRLAGPFLLLGAGCALAEGIAGGGTGWKIEDWFLAENSMSVFGREDPAGLAGFFENFPFAVRDPYYGYAAWAVFLPVCLALLAGLWGLGRTKASWPGSRAVFSLSYYAAIRILYESLRQDDIPKWGFVRVNQILSAILLMALLLLCWARVRRGLGISMILFWGGVILAGAMEFALEKKIGFLEWMPMDLCYVVSGAGCWMLFHSVNRLRKMDPQAGPGSEA